MASRKTLEGLKFRWEPQPEEIVTGCPMVDGSDLRRGTRIQTGSSDGTVLGTSDSGEWVGVLFDHCEMVTEYPIRTASEIERFTDIIRRKVG